MVVLLQAVLGLRDEHAGPLQALPAVSDLLGQLPQLHHLGEGDGGVERQALDRSFCCTTGLFTHHYHS